MNGYELVVGLEVHAQMATDSKLFSAAPNSFGGLQNSNVSFFDIAYPGTLPVLNMKAVEIAAKVGFAINGVVNKYSRFDRKHYFYPDLPSGYQITQFYHPIVEGGFVEFETSDGAKKRVGVTRIHIEQDAGKLIHDAHDSFSCVDFSRAGVPLMEIVTDCDIRSSEEAVCFLKKLRQLLRALGASNADMEKGSFRCDANISVRKKGSSKLGVRREIKNLNSFKFVAKAIEFEFEKQVEIMESGEAVKQETRLFDPQKGETFMMRAKSDADQYYYFPDPDLLPVVLSDELLSKISASLPELPEEKRKRYIEVYGLLEKEADDVLSDIAYCEYFDYLVAYHPPKIALGWIMTELVGILKKVGLSFDDSGVSKEDMKVLIDLVKEGIASRSSAKIILNEMIGSKEDPVSILDRLGLREVDNSKEIDEVARNVLLVNSDKVSEYFAGKTALLGFFVGQVVKSLQTKSDPVKVRAALEKILARLHAEQNHEKKD